MGMKHIRVAVGQMAGVLNDVKANINEARALAVQAVAEGARLLLLPEGCLTGNALSAPARQAILPLDQAAFTPLQAVTDKSGLTICAGFQTRLDGGFNVVHAIIQPRRPVRFQRKAARSSDEPNFIAPWPDPAREVFEVEGLRTVIVICSESGCRMVTACVEAERPALILHPSAGREPQSELWFSPPAPQVRETFRRRTLAIVEAAGRRAKAKSVARLAANPVGFDGETYWPGNSYGINADGSMALWMPAENDPARMRPGVMVGEIMVNQ